MKIVNPSYVSDVQVLVDSHKTAIQNYFIANANLEYISFDKVRADFPAKEAELTDGVISQICADLGIKVSQ